MTLNETKIGSKVVHPTRGTGIVTGVSGSVGDSSRPLCAQVTIGEVSHLFPLEVLRPAPSEGAECAHSMGYCEDCLPGDAVI